MQIALLGDVMLGRLVNDRLKTADPAYPWGDTLPTPAPGRHHVREPRMRPG